MRVVFVVDTVQPTNGVATSAQRAAATLRGRGHEVVSASRSGRHAEGAAQDVTLTLADTQAVVDLVNGKAAITGAVPVGYVYVDGSLVGTTDEDMLKDRHILRDEGFVTVIVVRDAKTGAILAGPDIRTRGFAEGDEVFDRVRPKIEQALLEARNKGVKDSHQLQQVIRRAVGGFVGGKLRRRPMIIPIVIEA